MEAPRDSSPRADAFCSPGRISSPRCICEQVPTNLRDALRWKGGQNFDNHHSLAWEPAQPQARPQIFPMGLRDLSQIFCPTDLHPITSATPGQSHFPLPGRAEAPHPFGMCCSMSCSCSHSPLFWEPQAPDPWAWCSSGWSPCQPLHPWARDSASPLGYREQIHWRQL